MGRQMIDRDVRAIGGNISRRLFQRAIEVQARLGAKTFTEVIERALQMYTDQVLGQDFVPGTPQTRPAKISLLLDEDEALEVVDKVPDK